jgi:hypothetical protein
MTVSLMTGFLPVTEIAEELRRDRCLAAPPGCPRSVGDDVDTLLIDDERRSDKNGLALRLLAAEQESSSLSPVHHVRGCGPGNMHGYTEAYPAR